MMSSGRPDEGIFLPATVLGAQRGDRESFDCIFNTFHLQVYRYAFARVRNASDAEDVAAETFAAAFRGIDRFRWRGLPFEAWLFRIARSKIVDHHRRIGRRPPPLDISSVPDADLPRRDDVVDEVISRDGQVRALAMLPSLSQDQQDVLALRFFAGLSVDETAGAMNRSRGAVKQLQFRAVTALRHRLEVKP